MSYDQSKVAFVDTETAGLDPEFDGIWEIAVIVDGVEHVWQQQLDLLYNETVQESVDPWVWENTRFATAYNHDEALAPKYSLARLIVLIRGRHMVGACPWFDSERLHRVILENQPRIAGPDDRALPWHYHLIDVECLIVGYLTASGFLEHPDYPFSVGLPWKSEELSLAIGVDPADFEPKHSALTDARWAKAIFETIMGGPA